MTSDGLERLFFGAKTSLSRVLFKSLSPSKRRRAGRPARPATTPDVPEDDAWRHDGRRLARLSTDSSLEFFAIFGSKAQEFAEQQRFRQTEQLERKLDPRLQGLPGEAKTLVLVEPRTLELIQSNQELRECRFGCERTTTAPTPGRHTTTLGATTKKSRTIHALQSLSQSSENLTKTQTKSAQNKQKTKSLFFSKNKSDDRNDAEEECDRRRRLRRLFVHYDIQSALSLDELFSNSGDARNDTRDDARDDASGSEAEEEESEFNCNALLAFNRNFRNELI